MALRTLLLRFADGVIVNGASGERYAARFGAKRTRLFRIPYTTDMSAFRRPAGCRGSDVWQRLLYSGQLVDRKGIQPFAVALRKWAELHPERRIELWVAGDGPLRTWLSSLKTPENCAIKLLGSVSYEDLPRIYARCGILAFPTLADEWGVVVNEAMACGLPVLGSIYSQAVEELVEEGVNGWLTRPDDPSDLEAAVERALTAPPSVLERMSRNAARRVEPLTPAWAADELWRAIIDVSEADSFRP